jgi:nucleoside-diphosphate-sugar epimerase
VVRVTLPYERILVTGASGFVGCRLCEHLVLAHGATVRGTYHRPARAARVARLGIELVRLDLADEASIAAAVDGCDAVVHCAYGIEGDERTRRELTGAAAGRVADAALRRGARRLVHLSSIAVWGFDAGPGEIDEALPPRRTGDAYVDGKVDAEEAVAEAAAHGLPAVVLRPANVYGPWSPLWTVAPVRALRAGDPVLVGDGAAPANTVYVDNLVSAVVFALADDRAVGRTFVVVDEDGVSWRGLHEAYSALAAPPLPVRSLPLAEWRRRTARRTSFRDVLRDLRSLVRSPQAAELVSVAASLPALRRVGARVLRFVPGGSARVRRPAVASPAAGPRVPALPSPELVAVQTSGAVFRARGLRSLGWTPPVQIDDAFELTAEWLRFAREL